MSTLPKDPCHLCLVTACCTDPCDILRAYMNEVYELAESDSNHVILDRFPKYLKESILDFVEKKKELNKKAKDMGLDYEVSM